jgi:hypothetical protein
MRLPVAMTVQDHAGAEEADARNQALDHPARRFGVSGRDVLDRGDQQRPSQSYEAQGPHAGVLVIACALESDQHAAQGAHYNPRR